MEGYLIEPSMMWAYARVVGRGRENIAVAKHNVDHWYG